jgi:hypothetical protein
MANDFDRTDSFCSPYPFSLIRVIDDYSSRLGTDSRSECIFSPSHRLALHPSFRQFTVDNDFVTSAANFIRKYNSHLISSNKKGVDAGRLRNLQAFMAQLA